MAKRSWTWWAGVSALASLSWVGPAAAQTAPPSDETTLRAELERLRQELLTLRQDYAQRLEALEARLERQEATTTPATPFAPTAPAPGAAPASTPPVATAPPASPPPVEAVPAGVSGSTGVLPVYGAASSKVFNPDIAMIGNFLGGAGRSLDPGAPALAFDEAEASFQAIVDPYARADFFVSFRPDGVSLEEGFLSFPTLPGGLLAKIGQQRADFGKINAQHPHMLPWTDRPLVAQNLLGGDEAISDAGISLARLFPNRFAFLEATAQAYAGHSSVFQGTSRSDLSYLGRLRAYRDLGESTNLDLGASIAWGPNGLGPDARTRLLGVDATFRWRPLRRAIYRRLQARTELVWSRREQEPARQDAFGFYASAEYQFARRFFAGFRLDGSDRADDAALRDKAASLVLTFWPSEFSQVRGQYRWLRTPDRGTVNELLFQLLFSIGAHGAHVF